MSKVRKPLVEEEGGLMVIANELDWSDFIWSDDALIVKNGGQQPLLIAPLKNYKYYQNSY